jgi:hypothetical protein
MRPGLDTLRIAFETWVSPGQQLILPLQAPSNEVVPLLCSSIPIVPSAVVSVLRPGFTPTSGLRIATESLLRPTGGNHDYVTIPGETVKIFDQDGPGEIRHICTTRLLKRHVEGSGYPLIRSHADSFSGRNPADLCRDSYAICPKY